MLYSTTYNNYYICTILGSVFRVGGSCAAISIHTYMELWSQLNTLQM